MTKDNQDHKETIYCPEAWSEPQHVIQFSNVYHSHQILPENATCVQDFMIPISAFSHLQQTKIEEINRTARFWARGSKAVTGMWGSPNILDMGVCISLNYRESRRTGKGYNKLWTEVLYILKFLLTVKECSWQEAKEDSSSTSWMFLQFLSPMKYWYHKDLILKSFHLPFENIYIHNVAYENG